MFDQRFSRRTLLKAGVVAGAGILLPGNPFRFLGPGPQAATAFSQSDKLRKFIQPLRGVGSGIPIAQPDSVVQPWWQAGVAHYTIDVGQFVDQLHPDLPNPTRLWGFGQAGVFRHLGGVIAAKRGAPVQVTFRNNLPLPHILPVDRTLMGTEGADNRADIHLHGGFVPWTSDGGPFAWWDPTGRRGPSFLNNAVLGVPGAGPNQAEYYYPNDQSARLMWYHDHAIGLTRLNAYAGIASAYVIFDDYEIALGLKPYNLPGPVDPRTVYLVFQDKIFVSDDIAAKDPSWPKLMPNSRPGDLWYAHVYDTERWDLGPTPAGPPPDPSVVPEFFADTMLVNGTVYPYLEVEQRQYRFRLLNACQARFLNPRLVYASGSRGLAATEPATTKAGPAFVQIGSEGGFLPAPAYLDGTSPLTPGDPTPAQLLLAPAERADLIVDFRTVPAGSILILYSDAPAPYPMGDPINDYFPGNPSTPASQPGRGPNTRTLLQIRVNARVGAADPAISLPPMFTPTDPFMARQTPGKPTKVPGGVPVRRLTLDEEFDEHGRLIQFLGTDKPVNAPDEFGRPYMAAPTEIVKAGSTEVWEIINTTGDTHPVHFHLVNVEVLSRQPFDAEEYGGGAPAFTGPAIAPDPNELGWKETVRMNPGQVTRVLMKFNLPAVPFTVPASPRLEGMGISGAEYVWHCHILEHEEHDMMRPLVVVG